MKFYPIKVVRHIGDGKESVYVHPFTSASTASTFHHKVKKEAGVILVVKLDVQDFEANKAGLVAAFNAGQKLQGPPEVKADF